MLRPLESNPISNIQWLDVNQLRANDYNPNVVLTAEMKLLKFSLLKQGWIQPILVSDESFESEGKYEVIDGFHRFTLTRTDPEINATFGGKVPVTVLHLSKAERMMLTIRINRAKGNHMAFRMHDIVSTLFHDLGISSKDIGEGIGADAHEVETLLAENVFIKKDVANVPYSKSWIPLPKKGREAV